MTLVQLFPYLGSETFGLGQLEYLQPPTMRLSATTGYRTGVLLVDLIALTVQQLQAITVYSLNDQSFQQGPAIIAGTPNKYKKASHKQKQKHKLKNLLASRAKHTLLRLVFIDNITFLLRYLIFYYSAGMVFFFLEPLEPIPYLWFTYLLFYYPHLQDLDMFEYVYYPLIK